MRISVRVYKYKNIDEKSMMLNGANPPYFEDGDVIDMSMQNARQVKLGIPASDLTEEAMCTFVSDVGDTNNGPGRDSVPIVMLRRH